MSDFSDEYEGHICLQSNELLIDVLAGLARINDGRKRASKTFV